MARWLTLCPSQFAFLTAGHLPGWHPHSGGALLCQSQIKTVPPQTYIQHNLTEVFSQLRLCQVDKNQPSFADLTSNEMTVEITVAAEVT